MSARRRDVLVLLVVAVFLGAMAYFAFPLSKTHLGLDLQGGLSVLLEAQDTEKAERTSEKMDQAVKVIQNRVNKLGVAEPEIQRQGEWKISVQLPGIENQQEALDIIGKTAVLEFYDLAVFGTAYGSLEEALAAAGVDSEAKLPAGVSLIVWPTGSETDSESATNTYYLVDSLPPVTGGMLKDAAVQPDNTHGGYLVTMDFNDEGAKAFADITDQLAEKGRITAKSQQLAIVLDGVVESAPTVEKKIEGGSAVIERGAGGFPLDEARNLALVLQTGALPVNLEPVSQNEIGATLGKTALTQALLAGGVGLLLIMLFMIAYYRLLGVVACVALVIYGVLFLGILNAIPVTMTLPGIAGIVLTLGMAVDANVLIFARIRDEVAAGKTITAATSAGFKKAFRAVFDCNMTTVITAIVLFLTATGGVKGFALTLGIGVVLSFLTAVAVTRSILNLLSGWRPFRSHRLLGLRVPKERMAQLAERGRP